MPLPISAVWISQKLIAPGQQTRKRRNPLGPHVFLSSPHFFRIWSQKQINIIYLDQRKKNYILHCVRWFRINNVKQTVKKHIRHHRYWFYAFQIDIYWMNWWIHFSGWWVKTQVSEFRWQLISKYTFLIQSFFVCSMSYATTDAWSGKNVITKVYIVCQNLI